MIVKHASIRIYTITSYTTGHQFVLIAIAKLSKQSKMELTSYNHGLRGSSCPLLSLKKGPEHVMAEEKDEKRNFEEATTADVYCMARG